MDKRVVLATHGMFCEGIKTSLAMILGEDVPLECVAAYVDLRKDYQKEFERIVSEHDYEHSKLIVLTDILGGSVNNEFMKMLGKYPFLLVTGLNFALLLEVVTCSGEELEARLPEIVQNARDHIVICNELVEGASDASDDEGNDF